MMEYTLGVILAGIFLGILDAALHTNLIMRPNPTFWKTALAFLVFQLIFDNLFTYWGIWNFNSMETMNIFVPFIPIENLIYGQELLAFALIVYTFLSQARTK